MAFKPDPDKKPRWEELSKAALIKTVKTLSTRQTKLLNQVAKLEREVDALEAEIKEPDTAQPQPRDRTAEHLCAVEFGYRAAAAGDSMDDTLNKWRNPGCVEPIERLPHDGRKFPWEG